MTTIQSTHAQQRASSRNLLHVIGAMFLAFAATSAMSSGLIDDVGHDWRDLADALPAGKRIIDINTNKHADDRIGWQRRSPDGADIADVVYVPNTPGHLFAGAYSAVGGTGGGLYQSRNGGANWQAIAAFDGIAVHDIEFAADGTIYVATQEGLRWQRAGNTEWNSLPLGIGAHDAVLDITINPHRAGTIWAGISDAQGLQTINLLRSDDAGRSWRNRTPAITPAMGCTAIAIDPVDERRMVALFAGAFAGGQVWISHDAGETWINRSAGLPDRPLRSVAFSGHRILIGGGQRLGQQSLGLYASDDEGGHWQSLNDAAWSLPVVTAIAVSPSDQHTLLIATDGNGVQRSADGGRSWRTLAGTETLSVQSLRIHDGDPQHIAIGSVGVGVLLSRNGGKHFSVSSQGMHALNVRAVAIDPADNQRLAFAVNGLNDGRIYTSVDAGISWTLEASPATRFNAVRHASDGSLHAISGGPSTIAAEGLYRRESDGRWSALGPDQGTLYETDIRALRIGKRNPDLIVMAGADYGPVVGFDGTVWRSQDRGRNWTKVHQHPGTGEFVDIELIETRTSTRMLAVFDDSSGARRGAVMRSDDGGTQWQPSANALPAVFSHARLCVSAINPDVAYLSAAVANGRSRIYRSSDGGNHWQQRGGDRDWIVDLACDPRMADGVFIVHTGSIDSQRRVEFSSDGGLSTRNLDPAANTLIEPGALDVQRDRDGNVHLLLASARGAWWMGI